MEVDAKSRNISQLETVQPTELPANLQSLPTALADAVRGLGKRASHVEMRAVIRRLCAWNPLSSEALATILGRNQHHLITAHLRPMTRDGEPGFLYPEQPEHPQQAYRTPQGRKKGQK